MQGIIAAVVGILVGAVVLVAAGRASTRQARPLAKATVLAWCALAFGLLALLAGGLVLSNVPALSHVKTSIGLAAAAVVVSLGAVLVGDRRWQTWVGLIAAVMPAAYWVVWLAGQLAGPSH
jgi:peptidoglycan/LPS O-acetylase OafA/YrhL